MQALWGLPCIQRALHRLFGAGAGHRRMCVIAGVASAGGAPAFERGGGRATTDTDHGHIPLDQAMSCA